MRTDLSVLIRENPRLGVAFWALFAFAASCVIATTVSTAQQTFAPEKRSDERGLSPEERRGKALYLRGVSSSGKEITAMVGELDVPGFDDDLRRLSRSPRRGQDRGRRDCGKSDLDQSRQALRPHASIRAQARAV